VIRSEQKILVISFKKTILIVPQIYHEVKESAAIHAMNPAPFNVFGEKEKKSSTFSKRR